MRFAEQGAGQTINVICKPWIALFGNHFGKGFGLGFLLFGLPLGVTFYIIAKKNETITKQHDLEIWFRKCLKQNLDLLFYIASLPTNRWVRRVLCWWPLDRRRPGNPRQHWFTKIIAFSRYKQMGTSENVTPKAKPGCELQTTLLCSQILLQE